jgi:SRSO17 transposase
VRVVTGEDTRGKPQWLLMEKAERDGPVEHYVLATLPKSMSRKQVVRRVKQRWRTERVSEDLKGELGLDHFEGHSYIGWQHHVSCVLASYAFLVSERARAFSPRPEGRVATTRSSARPERHFAASTLTFRLAVAHALVHWLPRCPS